MNIITTSPNPLILHASEGMEAMLTVEVDGVTHVLRGKSIRVLPWSWARQESGGVAAGDVVAAGCRESVR